MKPAKHATLKDFTDTLDRLGNHLPFKIMGKRRLADPKKNFNGIYYTGSMLRELYADIDDPDSISAHQSVDAPFGEILKVGCRLAGGSDTYSKKIIPNAKTGSNLLQADIVELDLSGGGKAFPKHRLSMIVSHSCGITNTDYASLIPIYLESDLDNGTVTALRGAAPKDFKQVRGNWLSNEQINYLGLPAVTIPKINDAGDRLLACLNLQMLVPKKAVPANPQLRLTYRGLSYFQMRLALLYMRDVQDSDDTREF